MREPFRALYLHVPFCVRRCAYCDFCTEAVPAGDARIDAHVAGLRAALERAADAGLLGSVQTVYIGGGTPTFLGPERLDGLLASVNDALAAHTNVAGTKAPYATGAPTLVEFTVEANPDSLTSAVLDVLATRGVTRLSIGVQCLDDAVLATLGRVHDASDALDAVQRAVARIGNVSADVICGVPGQTRISLERTISQLLDAGVSHVSIYPLMVEEGTPLERAIDTGAMPDVDDDEQAAHMLLAGELLTAAGLARYEVASYARPGRESRHNTAYWTGVPYLGLGRGASSMVAAADYEAVLAAGVFDSVLAGCDDGPGVDSSVARVRVSLTGESGAPEVEGLMSGEAICEDAMLAMRMSAGLDAARLHAMAVQVPRLLDAAARAVELSLARWSDGRLVPTERGWLMGNELYSLFWDCAADPAAKNPQR